MLAYEVFDTRSVPLGPFSANSGIRRGDTQYLTSRSHRLVRNLGQTPKNGTSGAGHGFHKANVYGMSTSSVLAHLEALGGHTEP